MRESAAEEVHPQVIYARDTSAKMAAVVYVRVPVFFFQRLFINLFDRNFKVSLRKIKFLKKVNAWSEFGKIQFAEVRVKSFRKFNPRADRKVGGR